MENRKYYLAAITAYIIWGFFSIPLRALKAYQPGEILYFRILVSLLVLAVIIIGFRIKHVRTDWTHFKSLTKKHQRMTIALTLVGGLLLIVNWLVFIYVVNYINIKTAAFSYFICPVLTAVLAFVLLKEKLTTLQWIAVGCCALSCVLIGLNSVPELGYSFLTALSYALFLISQRKNQGFDRILVMGIQMAFACLVLTLMIGMLVTRVPMEFEFYAIIAVIAIVFTVLAMFLNLFALNRINSSTIGILMYLNPLINFSLALVIFKEHVTPTQIVGYLIIVVALLLFNYHNFRKLSTFAR